MRRYRDYMDKMELPENLTERLRELKPRRRPVPVTRWAAAAAVLAVAVGIGAAWRLGRADSGPGGEATVPSNGVMTTETAETGGTEPDITTVDPGDLPDTAPGTVPGAGGYELTDGETVTYYPLPALNFQPAEQTVELDYALGKTLRDATEEEIEAVLTSRWREHLDIPDTAETEAVIWLRDEEITGLTLGVTWEGHRVVIEQLLGADVPTCCVCPDDTYGHTDVDGTDVVTLVRDNTCETKFFINNTGWKATVTGENYEDLTCRFVRLGVREKNTGLAAAFGPQAPAPAAPSDGADGADGMTTPAFDPTAK